MRFRLGLIAAFACVSGLNAASDSARLHDLFAEQHAWLMNAYPELATSEGYPGHNDRWTDVSPEAIAARKQHSKDVLRRLQSISPATLNSDDRLNYDLFMWMIQTDVEGALFPSEYLAVDPLGGGVHTQVTRALREAQPGTLKDYEDEIARLEKVPALVDQNIALLREGIRSGITQPKIVMRDVPAQVDAMLQQPAGSSVLLESLRSFPPSIAPEEQERLRSRAVALVGGPVNTAFKKWRNFLANEYLPGCRESIGLSSLPQGADWYRYNVHRATTTDLTPQQIHDIGQNEVKRIRAAMQKTIEASGFTGGFEEFIQFLRTDPRFYYTQPADLVMGYRDICKRIDEQLPKLFGKLPREPYGVEPIDAYFAPSQTTAFYDPGSVDGRRPGIYRVNTYRLDSRPKYEMEVLSMHESVPGHHLQIALAHELPNVPDFRRALDPTAFVEGWALYTEGLGYEIGFYKDPYSKFGQLSYEMWRACRLVVDTGMHAFGWPRQKAIDFMKANTALTEQNIVAEVDRYIAWPGQATAYKIGQLKIRDLRSRAEQRLGPNFDIRQFHDEVLSAGAIPMSVLETRVNQWIGEKATAGH